MLRSVKSQIVFTTSLIIIVILGATAYFVIDQKIKEINNDIFTKSVSFAELTNERIVTNYENNYKQQAFAHFDRELADIYSLNEDITGIAILDYNGERLYVDPSIQEHHASLTAIEEAIAILRSDFIIEDNNIEYYPNPGNDKEELAANKKIISGIEESLLEKHKIPSDVMLAQK